MSTRATIILSVDNKDDNYAFFRKGDGYPSSTGEDLIRICREADWDKDRIVEGMANSISEYTKRSYYREVAYDKDIDWDIEWMYYIDIPNRTVTAYELPFTGSGRKLTVRTVMEKCKAQQMT